VKHEDIEQLLRVRGEQIARENGYTNYRMFVNGRDACLVRLIFNYAILSDLTECGYDGRWCYSSKDAALAALNAWNGEGEPEGWHRHPPSGRRRPNGDATREHIAW
jgi:hypothetical protein